MPNHDLEGTEVSRHLEFIARHTVPDLSNSGVTHAPMSTGPPADPAAPFTHQRSLDGIRALAVLAVMFFHSGSSFAHAGFLGVDVFLVLSGFLITFLLLREISSTGHIGFKAFWLRRARRLLPALVLVLLSVAVFGAFIATDDEALGLRGDLLGSLFYIQNWRFIFSGQSYFTQFGSPSPLRHMWSLAIEEQWYLVWPLAFAGIVAITRSSLRAIAAVIIGLAIGSAALMSILYHPGGDATRAYYGTDTRAQALLIGAALAVAFSARRTPRTRGALALVQLGGAGGLAFLVWVVVAKSEAWPLLYRGGFSLVAIAAAAMIGAAMIRGPIRSLLALPPLPAIGSVSYGLYLWHWPIYVFLSPTRTGLSGNGLLATRLAVTLAVSVASYRLIEKPIREQRFSWVRNRVFWVPATAVLTALAILGLTAGGVAAQPRLDDAAVLKEFIRLANLPPRPGATRVLLVGDSIAFTLGNVGLPIRLQNDVWIRGAERIGCGLYGGTPYSNGVAGKEQPECTDWPQVWAQAVRDNKPDLAAILVGAWEVFDRQVDGRVLKVGTPEMEQSLRDQLDRARSILTADGAQLAILTTPCFATVRRDLGQWGEAERSDPARVQWLNNVWRRYAADHPTDVHILDVDSQACPGGTYASTIRGTRMRTDGSHFTDAGAKLMWEWLAPRLHHIAAHARR